MGLDNKDILPQRTVFLDLIKYGSLVAERPVNPFFLQGIQSEREYSRAEFQNRQREHKSKQWPPVNAIIFPLNPKLNLQLVIIDGHHRTFLSRTSGASNHPTIQTQIYIPNLDMLQRLYPDIFSAIAMAKRLQSTKIFTPYTLTKELNIVLPESVTLNFKRIASAHAIIPHAH